MSLSKPTIFNPTPLSSALSNSALSKSHHINQHLALLQDYRLCLLSHSFIPEDLQSEHPWAKHLLLIGIAGGSSAKIPSSFWDKFCLSDEYQDQQPDPLDRWSQRIGQHIAKQWQGQALLPFTGPPYWPFLTWSQRTGNTAPSRLGLHLHQLYGLWHSYRFAILVPWQIPVPEHKQVAYRAPCDTCHEPCVTACPVNAFAVPGHYAVESCRDYVAQCLTSPQAIAAEKNCAKQGCLARQACPTGQGSYTTKQQQHHMRVFARTKH